MTVAPARRGIPPVWFVRVGVSAVVLVLIFRFVPFAQVADAARRISPLLWLAALALFLAGHAVAAAKWRLLIGSGVSYGAAFRAHLAGLAANLALPGVAGGDVVRAGLVMKAADSKARLAVGSVADRLLDTLGLLLIALAGAALAFGGRLDGAPWLKYLLFAAVAGAVVAVAGAGPLHRWLARRDAPGKVMRVATKTAAVVAEMAREPGRLLACLALSVAVQCLFIGINIAFAAAAQVEAPAAAWAFAWASAKIIAILPISLGGLGVREASMAALLRPFGADPARVVAIGLIWQTVLYASGLVGFLVQLRRPAPKPLTMEAVR